MNNVIDMPNRGLPGLRKYLAACPPGEIIDYKSLVDVLCSAWDELNGGEESAMAGYKVDRIEATRWTPPTLTFAIERHGGTVMGSTRAEVQTWAVNVESATAEVVGSKRRQLYPMAPRLDVRPIADQLVALAAAGEQHNALKWSKDRQSVRVVLSKAIPSGAKQTVEGRRRRLASAVDAAFAAAGWAPAGRQYTYKRRSESC